MKGIAMVLALGLLAAAPARAEACGDKFLRVGRGARYQRGYVAIRPACIILYAKPRSPLAAAMRELEPALKRAGHKPTLVDSPAAIASALRAGHYNLVLAGLEDVAVAQSQAVAVPVQLEVIPVLHRPSDAERTAVERDYHCVAEAPGQKSHVLAQIDDLMERMQKGGRNRKGP
jgi:hypothetical protein